MLALALLALLTDDGFRPLFDGKTLDGWDAFGGKAEAWAVEDGLLVSQGDGGGWLGTTDELRRLRPPAGVPAHPREQFGHVSSAPRPTHRTSRGRGWRSSSSTRTTLATRTSSPGNGPAPSTTSPRPEPGHLKPTGEWNAMEIRAEGPHVVIRLNGATVVDDRIDRHPELEKEHTGLKRKAGRIGLQSHNGRVEFRKLELKDLGGREPTIEDSTRRHGGHGDGTKKKAETPSSLCYLRALRAFVLNPGASALLFRPVPSPRQTPPRPAARRGSPGSGRGGSRGPSPRSRSPPAGADRSGRGGRPGGRTPRPRPARRSASVPSPVPVDRHDDRGELPDAAAPAAPSGSPAGRSRCRRRPSPPLPASLVGERPAPARPRRRRR